MTLDASAFGPQVMIDVGDRCGGLKFETADKLFTFTQRSVDRSGLPLRLTIARRNRSRRRQVERAGRSGHEMVFTICRAPHALSELGG